MGDESFAQGIFPPPPGVMYGALRTAAIAGGLEAGETLDHLIAATEDFTMHSMSFYLDGKGYFPMPLDLIAKKGRNLEANALNLAEKPQYSNATTPYILRSNTNEKTENDPKIISQRSLEKYLEGTTTPLTVTKRSDYIRAETKIGIGRNPDSHAAEDGKLFRVQTNRLAKVGADTIQHLEFLVHYEGLTLPARGSLTLGAERKVAFFEKIATPDHYSFKLPVLNSKQFKIYLSTPAVFYSGWQPENLLQKYDLQLLTAALDRPIQIGGWDMQKRKPKPMIQCVPGGSVYYVEAASIVAAQQAAQEIHGQSISDNINETDYRKLGFGIAYIGKI
jgi:CRISPR-associated protein Cmr3